MYHHSSHKNWLFIMRHSPHPIHKILHIKTPLWRWAMQQNNILPTYYTIKGEKISICWSGKANECWTEHLVAAFQEKEHLWVGLLSDSLGDVHTSRSTFCKNKFTKP